MSTVSRTARTRHGEVPQGSWQALSAAGYTHRVNSTRRSDVNMIDLFAGPGGLDVAARDLNFEVTGIEWDDDAVATRHAAGLKTVHDDVRAYQPESFTEADVLAGGPPCQTFTVAGGGTGRRELARVLELVDLMAKGRGFRRKLEALEDERTAMVLEPLRWILEASRAGSPYRTIVLEQVPAVMPVWNRMVDALRMLEYDAVAGVLKAEQFGVPQTRRRAFLIARRDGFARLPEPTHRAYHRGVARAQGDPGLLEWVAMQDVIDRRGPFVIRSNYGTGGDPKARGMRRSDEPAATVTGKIRRNRVQRPDGTELERLEFGEAGALQTFPADFPWSGKDVAQQIGNAVPPLLAKHVLAAAFDLPVPKP